MIQIPDHIEGLIFDLDGTLADTMPLHFDAWTAAGKDFDVDITPYMIKAMAGIPTVQSVVRLNEGYGWSIDPFLFKKQKDFHFRRLKKEKGKFDVIQPVFNLAKEHKDRLPMTIGTGSARPNAIETLRDLGIIDWFKGIVAADDVDHHKPFPDTFLRCAEIMSISPDKCMVLEDGDLGIMAAKNAGMEVLDVREYL